MGETIELVLTSWYNDELAELAPEQQTRIEDKLARFRDKGWHAATRDRTVVSLRDGIYELRVLGTGPAFRVLFFVMPGRSPRVVVLTSCLAKSLAKKRQRLDAALERARLRRSMWLEQRRPRGDDARR